MAKCDPVAGASNRARMSAVVAEWPDETCRSVLDHLATVGTEHRLYVAHREGQAFSRLWARDVILAPTLSAADFFAR